jgi:hypothetical protein
MALGFTEKNILERGYKSIQAVMKLEFESRVTKKFLTKVPPSAIPRKARVAMSPEYDCTNAVHNLTIPNAITTRAKNLTQSASKRGCREFP